MNNEDILVSVCIPCYNAASTIQATIQSVLAQTHRNLEIIICDDQSKDDTVNKVKEFTDPRIQLYINPENLRHSGNYNKALSYAQGKYAKLLCADDTLESDCIEKQVTAFEENIEEALVMVTGDRSIINENGEKILKIRFPGKGIIDGKKAIKKSIRKGTNIFGEPGLPLLKTEALRKTSGVLKEDIYCNDFDLWCKILLHGNLLVLKESLFNFRILPGSITSKTKWSQIKTFQNYINTLHSDPIYGLTRSDLRLGKVMATVKGVGRNVVTKYILKK